MFVVVAVVLFFGGEGWSNTRWTAIPFRGGGRGSTTEYSWSLHAFGTGISLAQISHMYWPGLWLYLSMGFAQLSWVIIGVENSFHSQEPTGRLEQFSTVSNIIWCFLGPALLRSSIVLSQPIRFKTTINRDLVTRVFLRTRRAAWDLTGSLWFIPLIWLAVVVDLVFIVRYIVEIP